IGGASGPAAEPSLIKPLWEVKPAPFGFFDTDDEERFGESYAWCRKHIEKARAELLGKEPLIPPFFPMATDKFVVVNTPHGPSAYALVADPNGIPLLKEGEFYWYVRGDRTMVDVADDAGKRYRLDANWEKGTAIAARRQIYTHSSTAR